MTPRRKTLLKHALFLGLVLFAGFHIACSLESNDVTQLVPLLAVPAMLGIVTTQQPSKRLKQLQDEKASVVARMSAILDEADKENDGDLTAEQEEEYIGLESSLEKLDKRIKREAKFLESQRSMEPVHDLNRDTPEEVAERGDGVRVKGENWKKDPMCGYSQPRDFLEDVISCSRLGAEIPPQLRFLAAAGSDEQGTYSDAHGGFFVPEGMSPQVLSVGAEGDPTNPTDVPMTVPSLKFNARVDKNHSTSVSGGLTVGRRAETQTGADSRAEYDKVTLDATELTGVAYVTEELLEHSPISFAAVLAAGFDDEFPSKMLKNKIDGTGLGEPLGVLNSECKISIAKESMQAADTINATNIVKMRKRCWRYGGAIWIANHDTYEQLISVHIAGTNSDVFLFNPARGIDVPDTLLGRPIFFSEYAKTLGDEGDLILCNWSQYLWGTLGSSRPRRAESIHVRFLNHERTFKFWLSNDGRPWWRTALTPVNSTETLSPVVTLAERA